MSLARVLKCKSSIFLHSPESCFRLCCFFFRLVLADSSLDDEAMRVLVGILQKQPTIDHLDLSDNQHIGAHHQGASADQPSEVPQQQTTLWTWKSIPYSTPFVATMYTNQQPLFYKPHAERSCDPTYSSVHAKARAPPAHIVSGLFWTWPRSCLCPCEFVLSNTLRMLIKLAECCYSGTLVVRFFG